MNKGIIEQLNGLCSSCPNGVYIEQCPFKVLNGMNHVSRTFLFQNISEAQAAKLIALAEDCHCSSTPCTEKAAALLQASRPLVS